MKKSIQFLFSSGLIFIFLISIIKISNAQVELVTSTHRVYDFLDRMLENKIIEKYSSSMHPVSRREIAGYLIEINEKRTKISSTDKKFLDDYLVEFEYDIKKTLNNSSSFFSKVKLTDIFRDKKQKYLYAGTDSNVSFFWDGLANLRYFGANGDSIGKPHLLLAEIGTRIRGTLFNTVGFNLSISNGARIGGDVSDASIGAQFDPILASTRKFVSEGSKTFDSFEGYLRAATTGDWLGVTVGRTPLKIGTGFLDNLIVSDHNSAPFDFIKLDIQYKKFKYTFYHSSIVGHDSSGNQLSSKYQVFHRVELGPFFKNNILKLGFSEMILYSEVPITLTFLNPIAFLTSADLNTELPNKNTNNSIIALDAQFFPVRKLSLQGTWLIDDINFSTIGNKDKTSGDNKFGLQWGLNWQDAFTLSNLSFVYEYTRLDPFVYSHRAINNSYTNWDLPIGAALNPNSDEHAFRLTYDIGSRLNIAVTYKLQRTGLNYTDSLGNFINVGSNILNGKDDAVRYNQFLNGLRVNTNIVIAEITWQPIRQYYFAVKFENRSFNYTSGNRKLSDKIFWGSFRVDY